MTKFLHRSIIRNIQSWIFWNLAIFLDFRIASFGLRTFTDCQLRNLPTPGQIALPTQPLTLPFQLVTTFLEALELHHISHILPRINPFILNIYHFPDFYYYPFFFTVPFPSFRRPCSKNPDLTLCLDLGVLRCGS